MKMTSKFPGSCAICGRRFAAGADIDYDRSSRSASHWASKQGEQPVPADVKSWNLGAVWYVQNNGADGDDWSANNVRTGGAGAIGWRVGRTEELIEQLDALGEQLTTKTEVTK
jgi:hypothetical protein